MDYVKYIREKVGTDEINLTGVNVLIIDNQERVLLQKRAQFPFKWGLIGGIVELGEALEDTCIREAKEESGLDISDLILLGTTSGKESRLEFPNGDVTYFISIGYFSKNYSGELIADGIETEELRFFSFEDLPENLPTMHRKMIGKYYKKT